MQGCDGTKGTVKYPQFRMKGLKNKRRTFWAAERRAKQMRVENAERAIAEFEQEWEEQYGGGQGQY